MQGVIDAPLPVQSDFVIRLQLAEAHLREHAEHDFLHGQVFAPLRRRLRKLRWFAFLIPLGMFTIALLFWESEQTFVSFWFGLMGFWLLYKAIRHVINPYAGTLKQFRLRFHDVDRRFAYQPMELAIGEGGVEERAPLSRSVMRWAMCDRIDEISGMLVLIRLDGHAQIMPTDQVRASGVDPATLRAECMRWIEANRSSTPPTLPGARHAPEAPRANKKRKSSVPPPEAPPAADQSAADEPHRQE